MTLQDLGWNDFFAAGFAPFTPEGLLPARVLAQIGVYRVAAADPGQPDQVSELLADTTGKFRRQSDSGGLPAVGDWVAVRLPGEEGEQGVIQAVLPRKSKFSRKAAGHRVAEQVVAANIDTVLLVSGLDGDFNPRRIERYLIAAWDSGAQPVLVLNKADRAEDAAALLVEVEAIALGVPVHLVSARSGEGFDELRQYLRPGETLGLLGSSGVGKSTLINRLLGREAQKTSEVRESDDRGRHTTTHRELFLAPQGGLILDTPGMREVQLWEGEGLATAFADVEELAAGCRFSDCRHAGEPGCAIEAALASGELAPERLESYRKLQAELRQIQIRQDELLKAREKQRWKVIHKAQRSHYKTKRGD
jgi:ribosome biogenesis GTPase